MTSTTAPDTDAAGFDAAWQRWRAARLAALAAVDGQPTLSATYWLPEQERIAEVPGRYVVRDGGVVLELDEGASGEVDGERVAGAPVVYRPSDEIGAKVRFAAVSAQVIVREGRLGVRIFDHTRAGRVRDVGAFPPDRRFVVEASYQPMPAREAVSYAYALESAPREVTVPGVVRFRLVGVDCELTPLLDEGELLFVFADATTGHSTKAPSRFLVVPPPEGGLDRPGTLTLDFNRAFLPPCAFSDEFNCPLPPPHHRLGFAVTAGESFPELD